MYIKLNEKYYQSVEIDTLNELNKLKAHRDYHISKAAQTINKHTIEAEKIQRYIDELENIADIEKL